MNEDLDKDRHIAKRERAIDIHRKRRKMGKEGDPTLRRPPDPISLEKLRKAEESGKTERRVASKRMSLAEVNALILAFRKGDKKAETALYLRYIKRIKMLMRKSPWYSDIKDPESLSIDIWIKLTEWFKKNTIEKGEGAILSNRVRGMCRDQAVKDQRESASGDSSNPEEEEESKVKGNETNLYKLLIERDEFTGETPKKINETYLNMRMSFQKLITKCLKKLAPRQREVLDHMFFLGRGKHVPGEVEETERKIYLNHREVAERLDITTSAVSQNKKSGIDSLRDCLGINGVLCLDDIL